MKELAEQAFFKLFFVVLGAIAFIGACVYVGFTV